MTCRMGRWNRDAIRNARATHVIDLVPDGDDAVDTAGGGRMLVVLDVSENTRIGPHGKRALDEGKALMTQMMLRY